MKQKKSVASARIKRRWLMASVVLSALSGLGLHVAGHVPSHGPAPGAEAFHVLASALFLWLAGAHIRQHRKWYAALCRRSVRGGNLTLGLTLTLCAVVGSGLWLCTPFGESAGARLWHYRIGLVLLVMAVLHRLRHRPRQRRG